MPNIAIADICTALKTEDVIGTKVIDSDSFITVLHTAIKAHDFSKDRIPGQGFIQIPDAVPFVSAGVGHSTSDPDDYVLREYRGQVKNFLRREHSVPATGCAAVVYTWEAYVNDPEVTSTELDRIKTCVRSGNGVYLFEDYDSEPITHVLVAVLAFAGPQSPLSPHRFTANLAGGNHEAQAWTADEIRAKAREVIEYHDQWSTVAD